MDWLYIIVILLIFFYAYKRFENKEKFSNPPSQTDIDYLKNYIKVSKYTLDQTLKKINNDQNAKFTTAQVFMTTINNTLDRLQSLNNVSTTTDTFSNEMAPIMENFIKELITNIKNVNLILQLPQYVINNYNRVIEQINYNSDLNNLNKLNSKQRLDQSISILSSINTNIFNFVFNKLVTNTNDINQSINNIGTNQLLSNSPDLLNIDFSQEINNQDLTGLQVSTNNMYGINPPSDKYINVYPYDFGRDINNSSYANIDIIMTPSEQKGTLEQCKIKCNSMSNCNGFARPISDNPTDENGSCFYKQNLLIDNGNYIPNRKYNPNEGFNQWLKSPDNNVNLQYTNTTTSPATSETKTFNKYINVYPYGFGIDTNNTSYANIDINMEPSEQKGTLDDCKIKCNSMSNCNGFARPINDNPNDANGSCFYKQKLPINNDNYIPNRKYKPNDGFNQWLKKPDGTNNILNVKYGNENSIQYLM